MSCIEGLPLFDCNQTSWWGPERLQTFSMCLSFCFTVWFFTGNSYWVTCAGGECHKGAKRYWSLWCDTAICRTCSSSAPNHRFSKVNHLPLHLSLTGHRMWRKSIGCNHSNLGWLYDYMTLFFGMLWEYNHSCYRILHGWPECLWSLTFGQGLPPRPQGRYLKFDFCCAKVFRLDWTASS